MLENLRAVNVKDGIVKTFINQLMSPRLQDLSLIITEGSLAALLHAR